MTTAEKIGTLSPFDAILNWPMWAVVVFAAAATPFSILLFVGVIEARELPLSPKDQFLAFMPGDIFLSAFFVWSVYLAKKHLPDGVYWFNSHRWHGAPLFHLITLAVFLLVFVVLTFLDWKSGLYTWGQMLSPWKIYHNLLYAWYGDLVASTGLPVLGNAEVLPRTKAALFTVVAVWLLCLVYDSTIGAQYAPHKAKTAHVEFSYRTWTSHYVR